MNEGDVGAGRSLMQSHAQRVEHERCPHMRGELPADDPPAAGVDHETEEDQALPAAQVGEVGKPQLVGAGRAELPLNEIRRSLSARIGLGGSPRLATALGALQAVLAHQPRDTVATDRLAGSEQRLPHLP